MTKKQQKLTEIKMENMSNPEPEITPVEIGIFNFDHLIRPIEISLDAYNDVIKGTLARDRNNITIPQPTINPAIFIVEQPPKFIAEQSAIFANDRFNTLFASSLREAELHAELRKKNEYYQDGDKGFTFTKK